MISFAILALCALSLAGAGSAARREAYYRDSNCSLHLFFENKGKEPVATLSPVVDGFDTATFLASEVGACSYPIELELAPVRRCGTPGG